MDMWLFFLAEQKLSSNQNDPYNVTPQVSWFGIRNWTKTNEYLSSCWTAELSPPSSAWPQVTTDPSARIAANAWLVRWICCTPLSLSRTAELSPPLSGLPQVTTDPSARIAAKAWCVAWIYIYVVVRASALDLRLAQRQRAVTKH